jgi:hypothetical protein
MNRSMKLRYFCYEGNGWSKVGRSITHKFWNCLWIHHLGITYRLRSTHTVYHEPLQWRYYLSSQPSDSEIAKRESLAATLGEPLALLPRLQRLYVKYAFGSVSVMTIPILPHCRELVMHVAAQPPLDYQLLYDITHGLYSPQLPNYSNFKPSPDEKDEIDDNKHKTKKTEDTVPIHSITLNGTWPSLQRLIIGPTISPSILSSDLSTPSLQYMCLRSPMHHSMLRVTDLHTLVAELSSFGPVPFLGRLQCLRYLTITCHRDPDCQQLRHMPVAKLKNITHFTLILIPDVSTRPLYASSTVVDDGIITTIGRLPSLQYFALSTDKSVSIDGVRSMIRSCPTLMTLDLSQCLSLTTEFQLIHPRPFHTLLAQ